MAEAEKLDLYKKHKAEYLAGKAPALVETGPAQYLAIAGQGAPEGTPFQEAIGALYAVSFTIKMTRKFAGLGDYKVCHLEGIYWGGGDEKNFFDLPRDAWEWKLLIRTPDFIGKEDLAEAVRTLKAKGKPPIVAEVRLETLEEGRCVQMLHVGPYADEPASVARMEAFAKEQGLRFRGRHHEIYLSDPRRVPPERLRTILRYPVR